MLIIGMKTSISHLHQLKGKAFVKDAVDLRSARQVGGVHLISRPFDALLKVHAKLLHHPADCTKYIVKYNYSAVMSIRVRLHLCVCVCALTGVRPWSCV